jgi:hypothetical protein
MNTDINIAEFIEWHHNSKGEYTGHMLNKDDRAWIAANCETMQDVWNKAPNALLLKIALTKGVLTDNELRSCAIICCQAVWNFLNVTSYKAMVATQQYIMGEETKENLIKMCNFAMRLFDKSDLQVKHVSNAIGYPDALDAARCALDWIKDESNDDPYNVVKDVTTWLRNNVKPSFKYE